MEGITQEEGPKLFIFSLAYDWCNKENEKTSNSQIKRLRVDPKYIGILEISLIHTLQSKYIILSDKCFLGYKDCTGTHYLNVYLHAAPHGEYFSHTLHS